MYEFFEHTADLGIRVRAADSTVGIPGAVSLGRARPRLTLAGHQLLCYLDD